MAAAEPKAPINVMISGAAGQIGYSLIPLFANGLVFGPDQPMNLILLDIEPMMDRLAGTVMEINDGAYPLVESILPTFKHEEGFKDLDYAILVGGMPRKGNQTRADLLVANIKIFESAGKSLAKFSKPTCKVLVVANPANSNCYVCAHYACQANESFKKENFAALTRLDMNRATTQIATKVGALIRDIDNVVIWGNHSATQVPDIRYTTNKGQPIPTQDAEYLATFETTVQKRGKAVIAARGASSAMSAANGVKDCVRDWALGSNGRAVAMAIYTGAGTKNARNVEASNDVELAAWRNILGDEAKEAENKKCTSYAEPLVAGSETFNYIADMAPDTFFSVPCVCENGVWKAVDLNKNNDALDKDFIAKIAATAVELENEKAAGLAVLNAASST